MYVHTYKFNSVLNCHVHDSMFADDTFLQSLTVFYTSMQASCSDYIV